MGLNCHNVMEVRATAQSADGLFGVTLSWEPAPLMFSIPDVETTGSDHVELMSVGYFNSTALHAAALEPNLFGAVKLVQPLVSWANVVELGFSRNRPVNTVHGA